MPKKSGKNLRIALAGSGGRMGQEISALADIAAKVAGAKDWAQVKASGIDVVIEFSTPDGLIDAIDWCMENKKPLVSGTTGLSAADKAKLKKASKKIPVLYSANMSLGIAAMMAMIEAFSALPGWDFRIEETHHKMKKDSPSGTALLLHAKLEHVIGHKLPPPHAIRGGESPGIHEIHAMGPGEALVVKHTAYKRTVFAQGALNAARWLFDNKAPGLYDLSDLYKIRS